MNEEVEKEEDNPRLEEVGGPPWIGGWHPALEASLTSPALTSSAPRK
jgi:hypothetical protein